MINDIEKTNDDAEKNLTADIRKPYDKPLLETLGDLRTVTLGGSTTGFDQSGPLTGPFI